MLCNGSTNKNEHEIFQRSSCRKQGKKEQSIDIKEEKTEQGRPMLTECF